MEGYDFVEELKRASEWRPDVSTTETREPSLYKVFYQHQHLTTVEAGRIIIISDDGMLTFMLDGKIEAEFRNRDFYQKCKPTK